MIKNLIKPSLRCIVLIGGALLLSPSFAAQSEPSPAIHLGETAHRFPAAFEGEQLSHSFKIINRGAADLEIFDVTHS